MPIPFQARTERDLKRPGYCAIAHERTFINFVASSHLLKGEEITVKRLIEDFGIPRAEVYLVMAASRHLGFIDEQNRITNTLEQLTRETGEGYQTKFREILENSYADVYNYGLDPAHATSQEFKEAFQACNYEPSSMQVKMLALFRGLCRMAGIIPDESKESQAGSKQITGTSSSTPLLNDVSLALAEYDPMLESSPSPKTNGTIQAHSGYSLLDELLTTFEELHQELAQSAEWTQADRARWEKYVNINHTMLGNALKLMKGLKQ